MYKFNKDTLEFVKVYQPAPLLGMIMSIILGGIIALFIIPRIEHRKIEQEVMVIVAKQNEFSEEKLTKLISSLHFPFPEIVLAQAMHETSMFTSPVFNEHHNLFGMKCALTRITTSISIEGQYAHYDNWMDSVYDRALYSATYLSSIKTEDEYYSYLGQYYAEDPNYVPKLKRIIADKDLKSLFQ